MKLGLYVHIPFCVSKCQYCNFYSINQLDYVNDYLIALIKEIERESVKYKDCNIDTIFIGGGTPSILPTGAVSLIINTIKNCYNVDTNCEITMESNPNSIDYTKAVSWKEAGVNRISVGLQTTSNRLLKLIGRAHTFEDYLNCMDILKKVGFKNINADIMLGLPSQKQGDVKTTLKYCFNLGITHISAYTLILEEDTPLYNRVVSGELKLPKEEKVVSMFDYVLKQTAEAGYKRYEVSNFAKDNYACKHNINCWSMCNYVGFGCSAHSFFKTTRFNNISNVKDYIYNINNNISVVENSEVLDTLQLIEESIMLGLRMTKGVDLDRLKTLYNYDLLLDKSQEVNDLKALGLIDNDTHYLCATTEGFYVLNQIILKLVN
ncbi:MAG: radical SAM family heme chaperone HemW [Eubacteriales bacterium]|nr:radical SAM family heme chaperone HemW [Eubacteriales bacterium]